MQTADSRAAWSESLIAFEDALVLERYENGKLLELHHAAEQADDADVRDECIKKNDFC